jgi:uncharacterized phage-associated protein
MNTDKHRAKLINAIIYFAENTCFCYKLKLMKLLFYLDFWHFKETGRSVTGLKYKAWKMGPVPPDVYYQIDPEKNPDDFKESIFVEKVEFENGSGHYLKIQPIKKFNSKIFSKRELLLLEKIAFIFNEAKASDMTDSTHLKNSPWSKTKKEKGENEWIDYMLAIDDENNSLNQNDIDDRNQIENEFFQLFGKL